jgi:hypothetical protein
MISMAMENPWTISRPTSMAVESIENNLHGSRGSWQETFMSGNRDKAKKIYRQELEVKKFCY